MSLDDVDGARGLRPLHYITARSPHCYKSLHGASFLIKVLQHILGQLRTAAALTPTCNTRLTTQNCSGIDDEQSRMRTMSANGNRNGGGDLVFFEANPFGGSRSVGFFTVCVFRHFAPGFTNCRQWRRRERKRLLRVAAVDSCCIATIGTSEFVRVICSEYNRISNIYT